LKIAREDLAEGDSESVASAGARESVLAAIGNAHHGQDRVVESLERLLGELTEWDSYRQVAREVGRLRREQKETRRQTEQLRLDTLTLDPQAMSSAQRAEQRRLSGRQSEISRNFDRLQSRMTEMRERLEDREPLAAATLRDALEAAQSMALGSMLRDAGDQLRANRLGQATDRQSEVVEGLGHLLDLLANRRENTLDRVLGQLRDAAAELSELEQRQSDIRKRLGDPENHTAAALRELAEGERDLAEQIQRLAARLERLQARQAGDLLQQATQALKDASAGAENGDVSATQRNADLAADRMLQAQQQLQQSLGQTQQDLLREQLVRYQQLLTGVLQGQQSVLQETHRLDRSRAGPPDAVPPSWKQDALQVAEEELELQQVVTSLADQLQDAQILGVVLKEVAESMSIAEGKLRQLSTGVATQNVLQSTIDQLEQIVAALKTARDSATGAQQGMPQQADDQRQSAFLIAQLRILRELQESVNQRTRELDQLHAQGQPFSEVQQQQQRDLAARQGQVARLLAELLKNTGVAPPDRPDAKLDQLDQILDLD
jgi:hypothetical protein